MESTLSTTTLDDVTIMNMMPTPNNTALETTFNTVQSDDVVTLPLLCLNCIICTLGFIWNAWNLFANWENCRARENNASQPNFDNSNTIPGDCNNPQANGSSNSEDLPLNPTGSDGRTSNSTNVGNSLSIPNGDNARPINLPNSNTRRHDDSKKQFETQDMLILSVAYCVVSVIMIIRSSNQYIYPVRVEEITGMSAWIFNKHRVFGLLDKVIHLSTAAILLELFGYKRLPDRLFKCAMRILLITFVVYLSIIVGVSKFLVHEKYFIGFFTNMLRFGAIIFPLLSCVTPSLEGLKSLKRWETWRRNLIGGDCFVCIFCGCWILYILTKFVKGIDPEDENDIAPYESICYTIGTLPTVLTPAFYWWFQKTGRTAENTGYSGVSSSPERSVETENDGLEMKTCVTQTPSSSVKENSGTGEPESGMLANV